MADEKVVDKENFMEDENLYPSLGSTEAGYLFEFREDGVYLTIYPNDAASLLFELSDMRQILKDCNVADYDVALLSRTMRDANGLPQKIAGHVDISEEQLRQIASGEYEGAPNLAEEYAKLIVDVR